MVSVSFDHAIGFFVKHALHRRTRTDLVPHARLGLQVKSELVRGFERCFGWTPGMKAHVVQAPGAAGLKEFSPRGNVRGRITCEREVAAVVRTAKVDRSAVEDAF